MPAVASGRLAADAWENRRIAQQVGGRVTDPVAAGRFSTMIGVTAFGLLFTPAFYAIVSRGNGKKADDRAMRVPHES
jgi:hypothetical protein